MIATLRPTALSGRHRSPFRANPDVLAVVATDVVA